MAMYRRHLPHQVPRGFPIFLTWNLKGALPAEALDRLRQERKRLENQPRRPNEAKWERRVREAKILFALADRALDGATDGPHFLRDPDASKCVEDSILFGVPERYALYAWCVMSNHVHALFTPICDLKDVAQGIKGFTAHEINGMQNARGRTFWQDESYDHWARDEEELIRIILYIENNPVVAGLCEKPEDWRWSSPRHRSNWPRGVPLDKRLLFDAV